MLGVPQENPRGRGLIDRERAFLVVPEASKPLRIQGKLLVGRWSSGDRAQLNTARSVAGIGCRGVVFI